VSNDDIFNHRDEAAGELDRDRLWDELAFYPAELDPQLSEILQAPLTPQPAWFQPSAFATAAMLLIAVGAWLLLPLQASNTQTYQTTRGERMVVNLADGSVMQINSGSVVWVQLDEHQRHINIHRGEALFDVFRDEQRRFVVQTPNGRVEALGTRFNVNLYQEELIVTVAEGRVLVSNEMQASSRGSEVATQGQQVTVSPGGHISSERPASLQPALAWVEGKVIFRGETLQQAIEQVNRHSKHRVSIIDTRIASLPVYGVFNLGDSLGFLSALEKSYNIHAMRESVDLTYLAYRDRGQ